METLGNVNDVFSMTFYTYDRIRKVAGKSGDSAVSLYIRYIEQARLQGTDSTYSNDNFMMKAMGWSKEKFYKVKPILQNLGLIEPKEKRDENGKIISHYIQVNFVIKGETTTVLENQSLEKPESGKSNTNTICTKYKCLNTKNKYLYEKFYGATKGIDEKKCNKLIDNKLKQGVTLDDIYTGMVLYNTECRTSIEWMYVKKFESWITEFQPLTKEQVEETLTRLVGAYKKKKQSDEKYSKSKPCKDAWNELCETFGKEKINTLFKQADTNKVLLHLT